MKDLKPTCKIAVVQAAPIMFDKAACTEKAVSLIQECALKNAELIVFPGAFYPRLPLRYDLRIFRGPADRRRPKGLDALLQELHPGPR